jgi:hypothetical protein
MRSTEGVPASVFATSGGSVGVQAINAAEASSASSVLGAGHEQFEWFILCPSVIVQAFYLLGTPGSSSPASQV